MTIQEPLETAKENDRKTTKRVGRPECPPGRFVVFLSFSFAVSGGYLIVINLLCLYVISFRCLSLSSSPFMRPYLYIYIYIYIYIYVARSAFKSSLRSEYKNECVPKTYVLTINRRLPGAKHASGFEKAHAKPEFH